MCTLLLLVFIYDNHISANQVKYVDYDIEFFLFRICEKTSSIFKIGEIAYATRYITNNKLKALKTSICQGNAENPVLNINVSKIIIPKPKPNNFI